jgi:hypothetical protein
MDQILKGYNLELTTWVYLSSLLTIAIYFKFNRLWSMRNLDIVALVAMAPGLLLIDYGGDARTGGYIWLFVISGWFLIRLLIDLFMVRRPLLEPNLSPGGLTFIGASLLVFLMVNVLTKQPTESDLEGPRMLDAMLHREASAAGEQALDRHRPGFPLLRWIPSITTKSISKSDPAVPEERGRYMVQAATARTMAILSHVAVVVGMVLIGVWHFDNFRTGIASATLYLLLPYTAQMTGRVDHVLPAALLVLAITFYRRPMVAGMLLGLATGAIYYPFFLLPLWMGFYWHRGLLRFGIGYVSMLLVLLVSLAVWLAFASTDLEHFFAQMKLMLGWTNLTSPGVEGFWLFDVSSSPYRLPVLVLYAFICASFALWPASKNLGSLLSCSAWVMLGTQFWDVNGGVYIAWYLPLLLLTIFRPNLEDRIALATLGEWFIRRRLHLSRPRAAALFLSLAISVAARPVLAYRSSPRADGAADARPLNFTNDILPVLTKFGCNSGGCHGRGSGQNGFKLSLLAFDPPADYAALVEEGSGRRISWTAPDESLMLLKATGVVPHGGGARLSTDSSAYQLLREWIDQGTPWGDDHDPKLAGIDIQPAERVLSAGEAAQLRVVARYSDDSVRDVTPLAEYFSQHPAQLEVSGGGLVRSLGQKGEAIVTVRYSGVVAVCRLTVPYATGLPEPLYAAFEPKSFVDRLVLEKWRKLGLSPSPPASDVEFLRRASLDCIGTLPTPQEVREFLADAAADKRDRLVDRLLDRPEYAVFWGQRWGDVLRNKQIDQAQKDNSQKFTQWLRDAFAQNMPFDKFARELIAVSGKLEEHPQMDWYRQLNSPQNRVEDTCQVFLGLRVSCANCHNHPFERISQNDYWQFAAFFAKVDAMPYGTVKTVGLKDDAEMTNPRSGDKMTPKAFGGVEYQYVKGEDPRQKLVDWLVAKDNPYFARAVSNRLWAHYLKRGLVEAADDMRATNPPTNPALLDALAAGFVEHGFDLKQLTKTIMKSRVYGLSARPTPENAADKQNYARHYPQRLSPHVLLDALNSATGAAAKFNQFADAKRAIELPNEAEQNDFLDIFGRSRRDTPCVCETHTEPNLSQVLYLMFSPELQRDIAHAEGTVAKLVKENKPTAEVVTELYLRTLSRPPAEAELADAVALVDQAAGKQPAVEDLLWTLLNSKEFVFNH